MLELPLPVQARLLGSACLLSSAGRLHVAGASPAGCPLPPCPQNGGSFLASLACYALPGNPQCREAVERALVPLAAAVATAEPLAWQFKRCKEELGEWAGGRVLRMCRCL